MTSSACIVPGRNEVSYDRFQGPVPYRSLMPLSLVFPHPLPDKAVPIKKGETEVNWLSHYGSILVKESKASDEILVDCEYLRTALWVKEGLTDWLEVGFELPFLHCSSGFLDAGIENFHDTFGLPQGKRDKNPDNQFSVIYRREGHVFFTAEEDDFHLGDIPLYLKVTLCCPENGFAGLSARGTLELPTGDEDHGFGSGKIDGGVGLLAQKNLWSTLAAYFSVDQIFRKQPDGFKKIHVEDVTHASLALEQALTRSLTVQLQSDYQTRPLSGSDLREFKYPEWTGTVGLAWRPGDRYWINLSFTEGITTHTTPDFVVGMRLGFRF
ncbi:MAG: DUF3187 family protein [Planctomycetes bacterium]|nr:DUF3187 family protein [Planctomycetota bacterium]